MIFIGIGIAVFIIIIIYNKSKDKYNEAHPTKCDFCGRMVPGPTKLKDGHICRDCLNVPYGEYKQDLFAHLETKFGKLTISELRAYMNDLGQRGEMMRQFKATDESPTRKLVADRGLGLFYIRGASQYAHRISDIRSFKLHFDKDWDSIYDDKPVQVEGGHVEISLNEPVEKLTFEIDIDSKVFGMKNKVRQTYEGELEFLEKISGKRRG